MRYQTCQLVKMYKQVEEQLHIIFVDVALAL